VAILAASAAVAATLVRRHHRAHRDTERAAHEAPSTVRRAAPETPKPPATPELTAGETPGSSGGSAAVAEDPLTLALCPAGMLLVEGATCVTRQRRCIETDHGICRRFEPALCRAGQSLRFCVDRYEYPNLEGVAPATMVTFEQARTACDEEGKRLCSEIEWRFACEGREGFQFPYGDTQDPEACNVGRTTETLRPEELWEPRDVSRVLSRVDRRVASGAMSRCTSPFGVRDMTGNVEEWGSGALGIESALLGGDVREQAPLCRTVRKTSQTSFRSPHTGFRCCRDPLFRTASRPSATPAGPGAR